MCTGLAKATMHIHKPQTGVANENKLHRTEESMSKQSLEHSSTHFKHQKAVLSWNIHKGSECSTTLTIKGSSDSTQHKYLFCASVCQTLCWIQALRWTKQGCLSLWSPQTALGYFLRWYAHSRHKITGSKCVSLLFVHHHLHLSKTSFYSKRPSSVTCVYGFIVQETNIKPTTTRYSWIPRMGRSGFAMCTHNRKN